MRYEEFNTYLHKKDDSLDSGYSPNKLMVCKPSTYVLNSAQMVGTESLPGPGSYEN